MSWDLFILRQQSISWGTLLSSITAQLRELFRECRLPELTLRDLSTQNPVALPQHDLGDETAYPVVVLDGEASIGISYDRVGRSPRSPDWFWVSLGGARTDSGIVLGVIAASEIC